MSKKILIIDDEKFIRATLREILEYEKYEVEEAQDGQDGLDKLIINNYDVVLCDIKMPQIDGLEVLEKTMALGKDIPFIMISAHGTIETAVEATKKGAFDFIVKPPDLNRLLLCIRNAIERGSLVKETKVLKKKIARSTDIIGESKALLEVKEMIDKVAPTEARVLITGANGTGKELIAKGIHAKSNRNASTMIEVNCAAIPSELIESELFGHEKGSFTSAVKQRIGKFEQASKGTLFLDEIGDMSLSAQAKVLRALQENKITRVGGEKEIKVDVRVLAATNKDLKAEIKLGRFREDLYHRLSVIIIKSPSLKDRLTDIPLLADHFLQQIAQEYGQPKRSLTKDAIKKMQEKDWTGNIREFRNVIERLVIMTSGNISGKDVEKYASN
jgi:DNA-binding NtrC family response regulator